MTGSVRNSLIIISILMAAIILGACSSSSAPQGESDASYSSSPSSLSSHMPINGLVQSNTGGKVDIAVEWIGDRDNSLLFSVSMNTHSVDLDRYDLAKLALLQDDMGIEYHPTSWDSAPGGHHRQGTLTFPLPNSLSQDEAEYLQLIIRDVAGVAERILLWELG